MTTRILVPDEHIKIAEDIYSVYKKAIRTLWGINSDLSEVIGEAGNILFEAEFEALGPRAYETSIIMPLRNAWYNSGTIPARQARFFVHNRLRAPILDYGCGVGFQLVWLTHMGYAPEDLWGWDVEGPQAVLTRHVFKQYGINWGLPESPQTILCFHVLEHLPDPFATIDSLRQRGGQLYASCVGLEGHGHLVDADKSKQVIAYLRERGEFVEDYWGPTHEV